MRPAMCSRVWADGTRHTGGVERISEWRASRSLTVVVVVFGISFACTWMLAYRSDVAELGDGTVQFWGTLIVGVVLFVVPLSFAAHRVVRHRPSLSTFVVAVCTVVSLVVASAPPGNLTALVVPLLVGTALALFWLAGMFVDRRSGGRRNRPSRQPESSSRNGRPSIE